MWIVPAAGGSPRHVGANLAATRYPIWSNDGKHLLINGYSSSETFDKSAVDWWLVSASSGAAVRTRAFEALAKAGLAMRSRTPVPAIPRPQCWSAEDGTVTFSARSGDTSNLWRIGISPATGRVIGPPERLTIGAGNDTLTACASGLVAFASNQTKSGPWLMPFDFAYRRPKGDPQGFLRRRPPEILFRSGQVSVRFPGSLGRHQQEAKTVVSKLRHGGPALPRTARSGRHFETA